MSAGFGVGRSNAQAPVLASVMSVRPGRGFHDPTLTPICPPMPRAAGPSHAAPEGTTTGESREPLGDKLARSDGVLCPPAGVDPEMRAPTPEGGNTPVIPPPGSPGGDPSVRPK